MGTYQIGFLLSSFCLAFVFSCVCFLCPCLCHPLIIARLSCLLWRDAGAPFATFLLLRLVHIAKKAPKRGWWLSCSGPLLDRVCLSLERGFASMYSGPGECSVEVCLVCWPV